MSSKALNRTISILILITFLLTDTSISYALRPALLSSKAMWPDDKEEAVSRSAAEGYITQEEHEFIRAMLEILNARNNNYRVNIDIEEYRDIKPRNPMMIVAVPGLYDLTGLPDHVAIVDGIVYVDSDMLKEKGGKDLLQHAVDELDAAFDEANKRFSYLYPLEQRKAFKDWLDGKEVYGRIGANPKEAEETLLGIHNGAHKVPDGLLKQYPQTINVSERLRTIRTLKAFLEIINTLHGTTNIHAYIKGLYETNSDYWKKIFKEIEAKHPESEFSKLYAKELEENPVLRQKVITLYKAIYIETGNVFAMVRAMQAKLELVIRKTEAMTGTGRASRPAAAKQRDLTATWDRYKAARWYMKNGNVLEQEMGKATLAAINGQLILEIKRARAPDEIAGILNIGIMSINEFKDVSLLRQMLIGIAELLDTEPDKRDNLITAIRLLAREQKIFIRGIVAKGMEAVKAYEFEEKEKVVGQLDELFREVRNVKPRAKALVVCGGFGERTWPLVGKQHYGFIGEGTFMEQAVDRAIRITGNPKDVYLQTAQEHVGKMREVCERKGVPLENIIVESKGPDTAAAFGIGFAIIRKRALARGEDTKNTMGYIVYADHYIPDEQGIVARAKELGQEVGLERILGTVGIKPTHPSIDYGYLMRDKAVEVYGSDVARLSKFEEKPPRDVAEGLIEASGTWNSGLYVANLDYLIGEVERNFPEFAEELKKVIDAEEGQQEEQAIRNLCDRMYAMTKVPGSSLRGKGSFDFVVAEKVSDMALIGFNGTWYDAGSWDALRDMYKREGKLKQGENLILVGTDLDGRLKQLTEEQAREQGYVTLENCTGCTVIIANGEGKITLKNLKDMSVILNAGTKALTVLPRGKGADLKKLVDIIKGDPETNKYFVFAENPIAPTNRPEVVTKTDERQNKVTLQTDGDIAMVGCSNNAVDSAGGLVSMFNTDSLVVIKKGNSVVIGIPIDHLSVLDREYFLGLLAKLKAKPAQLVIGKNFILSAMLTAEERRSKLGKVDLKELTKQDADAAQDAVLIFNPLDGGIGTGVVRDDFLVRTVGRSVSAAGKPVLSAKALDCIFTREFNGFDLDGNTVKKKITLSVFEAKLCRAIKEAQENQYGEVVFQALVNDESRKSVERLFQEECLFDRLDDRITQKRSYYDYIKALVPNMKIADVVGQGYYPNLSVPGGRITVERLAPGGHGFFGYKFLQDALEGDGTKDGKAVVRAIYNDDGANNMPNPAIVGWMIRNNIPIVMVTTSKTGLDKQGGQIGIEQLANGMTKIQILELGQTGQEQRDIFLKMGLEIGEAGEQYFNTNLVLINYRALNPIVQRMIAKIGIDEFKRIIMSDAISNKKKAGDRKYIQLEGAIGSCVLNLNGYMRETGEGAILSIVNASTAERSEVFTPIKNAFDFWVQFFSDMYEFDAEDFRLIDKKPGHKPAVTLEDAYYKEIQNVIDSFGSASTIGLETLNIKGKVGLRNAVLAGKVYIDNRSEETVDLNSPEYRSYFDKLGLLRDGRLNLKDVTINIDEHKRITIQINAEEMIARVTDYKVRGGHRGAITRAEHEIQRSFFRAVDAYKDENRRTDLEEKLGLAGVLEIYGLPEMYNIIGLKDHYATKTGKLTIDKAILDGPDGEKYLRHIADELMRITLWGAMRLGSSPEVKRFGLELIQKYDKLENVPFEELVKWMRDFKDERVIVQEDRRTTINNLVAHLDNPRYAKILGPLLEFLHNVAPEVPKDVLETHGVLAVNDRLVKALNMLSAIIAAPERIVEIYDIFHHPVYSWTQAAEKMIRDGEVEGIIADTQDAELLLKVVDRLGLMLYDEAYNVLYGKVREEEVIEGIPGQRAKIFKAVSERIDGLSKIIASADTGDMVRGAAHDLAQVPKRQQVDTVDEICTIGAGVVIDTGLYILEWLKNNPQYQLIIIANNAQEYSQIKHLEDSEVVWVKVAEDGEGVSELIRRNIIKPWQLLDRNTIGPEFFKAVGNLQTPTVITKVTDRKIAEQVASGV